MKRSEIRDFLKAGVNALTPVVEFGSGRLSEFASIRNHQYPSVWQNIKPVNTQLPDNAAPVDQWDIEILIAQKDTPDSVAEQYEHIIDDADFIAQKLIYLYRNVIDGYKKIVITDIVRTPFVKKNSPDCISGITLTFKMTVSDRTRIC